MEKSTSANSHSLHKTGVGAKKSRPPRPSAFAGGVGLQLSGASGDDDKDVDPLAIRVHDDDLLAPTSPPRTTTGQKPQQIFMPQ